jgi:hypothetical protein
MAVRIGLPHYQAMPIYPDYSAGKIEGLAARLVPFARPRGFPVYGLEGPRLRHTTDKPAPLGAASLLKYPAQSNELGGNLLTTLPLPT